LAQAASPMATLEQHRLIAVIINSVQTEDQRCQEPA
jgi:hypothetical protein